MASLPTSCPLSKPPLTWKVPPSPTSSKPSTQICSSTTSSNHGHRPLLHPLTSPPLCSKALEQPCRVLCITSPGNQKSNSLYYIRLPDYESSRFNIFVQSFPSPAGRISDKERTYQCIEPSSNFILIRTFIEIEAKYIYLYNLANKKMVPIGPLLQEDDEEEEFKV